MAEKSIPKSDCFTQKVTKSAYKFYAELTYKTENVLPVRNNSPEQTDAINERAAVISATFPSLQSLFFRRPPNMRTRALKTKPNLSRPHSVYCYPFSSL